MNATRILVVGLVLAASAAGAQSPVARGEYLVESILTCVNCHSPRGPGGMIDPSRRFAGGPRTWETSEYKVKGSNITPDKATGIGTWTPSDVKRALLEGRRPSGRQLSPQMPYAYYKVFTPRDIEAVVAYLLQMPAISNEVPPPVYKVGEMRVDVPPGAEKAMSEDDMGDPVKRGFYLVTIGHCMECHTPVVDGRRDFSKDLGRGGERFEGPFGVSISRNITSHKSAGIGAWSDDEIKRAITQGIGRDGSRLKPPMQFTSYARMTPSDLDAIVAYLRTVPPVDR